MTHARSVRRPPACSIDRLETRYQLPSAHADERHRLDRVISTALSDMLEAAIERAGVPLGEEICVRTLHIVSRVKLDARDDDLALAWSFAVAAAIAQEIHSGGSNIIRYASRHHALCDMAIAATRGDTTRVWAWRQLGIWSGPETTSDALFVASVLTSLVRDAGAAAPVLAEVARRGWLVVLARQAPAELWTSLAVKAVEAFGGEGHAGFSPDEAALVGASDAGVQPAAPIRAQRTIRSSAIVAAMRGQGSQVAPATLRALATLAAIETTPEIVTQASELTRVISDVELVMRAQSTEAPERESVTVSTRPLPQNEPVATKTAAAVVSFESPAADEMMDFRQRATTRAGGVLFLLHLAREQDLPLRIVADPILGGRSLAWSLHRLATALSGAEPTDPAALAFCGRRPDDEPPDVDEPAATGDECAAIERYRELLVEELAQRLANDELPERLLASVVRRRAEIVADPGWIEARFELNEVSVPVRRAGLDLDPDWLPWIGVVMRFVYG